MQSETVFEKSQVRKYFFDLNPTYSPDCHVCLNCITYYSLFTVSFLIFFYSYHIIHPIIKNKLFQNIECISHLKSTVLEFCPSKSFFSASFHFYSDLLLGTFIDDVPYQGRQGVQDGPKKGTLQSRTRQVGKSKMAEKRGTSLMDVPHRVVQ